MSERKGAAYARYLDELDAALGRGAGHDAVLDAWITASRFDELIELYFELNDVFHGDADLLRIGSALKARNAEAAFDRLWRGECERRLAALERALGRPWPREELAAQWDHPIQRANWGELDDYEWVMGLPFKRAATHWALWTYLSALRSGRDAARALSNASYGARLAWVHARIARLRELVDDSGG
ncbi:hypothetical protein [Jannaschia aquimarina]|uniref:Uncharacterized protein n=1 Tax=Jannaschia aquimarina TaxID=935700 RepID=A0A0D1CR42_9RHOB|nr:hypothetical protein [Jannaschia aquimarina]KIT17242.1 hypothetical protein jaqu_09730 [Jannaschia aquimarina]SNT18993.1 hypothetical protein SAMN05421775_10799 [Jannaschia aquimarina]